MVWCGRLGRFGQGCVRLGVDWHGTAGEASWVMVSLGTVRYGTAWQAIAKGGDLMVHIVFEYADAMSGYEWRKQECTVSSVEECIRIYGLGVDCEYRIISVEKV